MLIKGALQLQLTHKHFLITKNKLKGTYDKNKPLKLLRAGELYLKLGMFLWGEVSVGRQQ